MRDRAGSTKSEAIARGDPPPSAVGSLSARARLRQDELAADFGVSITPVREALRVLESERLLVAEPHRGVRVAGADRRRRHPRRRTSSAGSPRHLPSGGRQPAAPARPRPCSLGWLEEAEPGGTRPSPRRRTTRSTSISTSAAGCPGWPSGSTSSGRPSRGTRCWPISARAPRHAPSTARSLSRPDPVTPIGLATAFEDLAAGMARWPDPRGSRPTTRSTPSGLGPYRTAAPPFDAELSSPPPRSSVPSAHGTPARLALAGTGRRRADR